MRAYAVMKFYQWEKDLELVPNMRIPWPSKIKNSEDGCIGFMPIFETMDDALKITDDMASIQSIEIKEPS